MRKFKRKTLSLLLALTIALSLFSVSQAQTILANEYGIEEDTAVEVPQTVAAGTQAQNIWADGVKILDNGVATPEAANEYSVGYDTVTNTLTIKASIDNQVTAGNITAGIIADGDMTIFLNEDMVVYYGIYVDGNLTVNGNTDRVYMYMHDIDSSVGGVTDAATGNTYGLYASGSLSVSGKITLLTTVYPTAKTATSYGVYAGGNITVNDGDISFNTDFNTGSNSVAVYSGGSIVLNDGGISKEYSENEVPVGIGVRANEIVLNAYKTQYIETASISVEAEIGVYASSITINKQTQISAVGTIHAVDGPQNSVMTINGGSIGLGTTSGQAQISNNYTVKLGGPLVSYWTDVAYLNEDETKLLLNNPVRFKDLPGLATSNYINIMCPWTDENGVQRFLTNDSTNREVVVFEGATDEQFTGLYNSATEKIIWSGDIENLSTMVSTAPYTFKMYIGDIYYGNGYDLSVLHHPYDYASDPENPRDEIATPSNEYREYKVGVPYTVKDASGAVQTTVSMTYSNGWITISGLDRFSPFAIVSLPSSTIPNNANVPATGDENSLVLWIAVAMISLTSSAFIATKKLRKQN